MLPLRDLQSRFDRALFDDAPDGVTPWIRVCSVHEERGGDIDAGARLAIYRNNLREGFIKALALEFPVIERLVGNDYFRQLALEFLAEYPSRAGDLHPIGEPFPQYLRLRFGETPYAYLPDVAALEWAYQQALIAADARLFDLATLREIPEETYGRLRFTLHPACGLMRSPYPVMRIWAANQPDAAGDEVVDLSSGADFILIRRAADGVEIRSIAATDFAVLDAFSRGAFLADALETALGIDPDFDLGEALRCFIGLGVLTATHAACPISTEGSSS
jgi:hypothetical protein